MNLPTFKCRASAISKIMSNSRSNPVLTEKQEDTLRKYREKVDAGYYSLLTERQRQEYINLEAKEQNGSKVILSDSCIEYLMEWYAWQVWGKRPLSEQFEISQLQKGKLAENDSIALLSVVDGVIYEKNDERIENDYLSGEPDVYLGEQIIGCQKIVDVKTCYDAPIFLKKINVGLENGYNQQVQGYLDISGAPVGEVAYTLVNMPEIMRMDFKKRLFYQGEYVTEESPDFLRKWSELENDMVFDKIPHEQRVHRIKVEPFTPSEQQRVYDRVKVCREWLANFHEQRQKLSLKDVV